MKLIQLEINCHNQVQDHSKFLNNLQSQLKLLSIFNLIQEILNELFKFIFYIKIIFYCYFFIVGCYKKNKLFS